MLKMQSMSIGKHEPLHFQPGDTGVMRHAQRVQSSLNRRRQTPPLYGHLDLLEHTVVPEIALAKVRKDAPFDKIFYIGCGVTTGIGAVIYTAKVEPSANVVVFGLGGIGLNVVQGARLAGANMIIGVDINEAKKRYGRTLLNDPLR